MSLRTFILLGTCLALAALVHAEPAAPVPGGIHGTVVTTDAAAPPSDMVVYLEPRDGQQLDAPAPPPVEVSQKGARFAPSLLVVSVGQTVHFLNDEDRNVEHNVFSNSPARRFDLGLYGPEHKRSVTFDKPGPVLLYCSIHRFMDGVVYVSPTPFHAIVNADGTFNIEKIPPGQYRLSTWQRRRRFLEQSVPIELGAGEVKVIDLDMRRK